MESYAVNRVRHDVYINVLSKALRHPDLARSGKLRSKPSLNELTKGNLFQGLKYWKTELKMILAYQVQNNIHDLKKKKRC